MKNVPTPVLSRRTVPPSRLPAAAGAWLVLAAGLCLPATSARANVYATNLKLHDAAAAAPPLSSIATNSQVILGVGHTLQIDYMLNDDASGGLALEVFSGTNTVRTIRLAPGAAGTARGTNSVPWDGLDNAGNAVASAFYSVRISASASGYTDWTQLSDDLNANYSVWESRGIAVNRNSNSAYYGRIFVGNAYPGTDPGGNPSDRVGFQKLNPDGTPAEEGIFSDGGWAWAGDFYSPWKVEVSPWDYVYVNDWTSNGVVLSFDQALTPASRKVVLRRDNWPQVGTSGGTTNGAPNYADLSGPFLTSIGVNNQLWMADTSYNSNPSIASSVGLRRWNIPASGVLATNDLGSTVVAARGTSDLSLYPYDVAVDSSNRIYTIQNRQAAGDPYNRLFRFPAYDDSGTPELKADWMVGGGDNNMRGAYGVAVDSTGTYVAVAFIGDRSADEYSPARVGGAARVFYASNGVAVTSLTPATYHSHTDVAWDNVGNLYTSDNFDSVWRVFSPPGTNFASTLAVQTVLVGSTNQPPVLAAISNQTVLARATLTLTTTASDPNGDQLTFSLGVGAGTGASVNATNGVFTWTPTAAYVGSNYFQIVVTDNGRPPLNAKQGFAVTVTVASQQRPVLSAPVWMNNQVQFKLIGEPNVAYVILASSNLVTWTPVLTNQEPTAVRLITLPANSRRLFYEAAILGAGGVTPIAPPVLSAPGWTADQFRFTLSGQANARYVILSSTNLINWTPIATNQAAAAVRVITVPAPAKQGFVRAMVGP